MSLIRQIKADWICSELIGSIRGIWLLSLPGLDLGVPFNFFTSPYSFTTRLHRDVSFSFYYTSVILYCLIYSEKWRTNGGQDDRPEVTSRPKSNES